MQLEKQRTASTSRPIISPGTEAWRDRYETQVRHRWQTPGPGKHRPRPDRSPVRLSRRKPGRAAPAAVLHDDQPGDGKTTRAGRAGGRGRCRPRGGGGTARLAAELVEAQTRRARQVPVPDRPCAAGTGARIRGDRDARRRQADPRVARHRRAARGGALLLLRGLGRQARLRLSRPARPAARRGRADHPVEFSAADGGLENRARARLRQYRGPETRGNDAAHRAEARRAHPRRAAPGR